MSNPFEIILVLVVLSINTSIDCENQDFCTSYSFRTTITVFNIGPNVYIKRIHLNKDFKQRHFHLWHFDQINSKFNELNVKDLFKGKFIEVTNALGLTKLECVSNCADISDLVIAIGYENNKTDSEGNREFIYSLFKPQSDGTYEPTDHLPEWGLRNNGYFGPIPDHFWDKSMANIKEILDFIFFSNTILMRFITLDYRVIAIMKHIYTNGTVTDKWTPVVDYKPVRGKSAFQLDQWFYNVMEGDRDSYIANRFALRSGIVSGHILYDILEVQNFNMTYASEFFNCSEASSDSTSISWSSGTEPNMYSTNATEIDWNGTEPPQPRFVFVSLIVISLISIAALVVGLIYFIVTKCSSDDEAQDEASDDLIEKQNVLKPNQKAIQQNKTTLNSTSTEPKLETNTKLTKTRERNK